MKKWVGRISCAGAHGGPPLPRHAGKEGGRQVTPSHPAPALPGLSGSLPLPFTSMIVLWDSWMCSDHGGTVRLNWKWSCIIYTETSSVLWILIGLVADPDPDFWWLKIEKCADEIIENCNFLLPRPLWRMSKVQKSLGLKRGHPAL